MRWFVDVNSLGKAAEKQRYCVDATSWQQALQAARTLRGDPGPMTGFSIELLDDGFAAVDPVKRQRYAIKKAPEDAALTGAGGPPSVPPPSGTATPSSKRPTASVRPPTVSIRSSRPPPVTSEGASAEANVTVPGPARVPSIPAEATAEAPSIPEPTPVIAPATPPSAPSSKPGSRSSRPPAPEINLSPKRSKGKGALTPTPAPVAVAASAAAVPAKELAKEPALQDQRQ